jgi:hypothetical protein
MAKETFPVPVCVPPSEGFHFIKFILGSEIRVFTIHTGAAVKENSFISWNKFIQGHFRHMKLIFTCYFVWVWNLVCHTKGWT